MRLATKSVLAAGGLALLGAACNAITGIGDYHVGDAAAGSGGSGGSDGATGGGAGTGGSIGSTCVVNKDCAQSAGPAICRKSDHTCVGLMTKECPHVAGAFQDDNAIILGSIQPILSDKATGLPPQNSIELAMNDFQQTYNGLPPATASGERRPFALVGCEENDALPAAAHLINDVQVPAIIGPAYSGDTKDVATMLSVNAGVLLVSPSATSPFLTTLDDKGLVWRTCPSDVVQAKAISLLSPTIEAKIKGAKTSLKLVILHKGDSYGSGLVTSDLLSEYSINGKPVNDASNVDNVKVLNYGDPDDDPTGAPAQIKTAVQATDMFAPDIIYIFGTAEGFSDVLKGVETGWISPERRPQYILSDGCYSNDLVTLVAASPPASQLRSRIYGTVPAPNTGDPNFSNYVLSYNSMYQDMGYEVSGAAQSYDALYAIAYAAVAVGSKPITGANLAAGLHRVVPPGPTINVGQSGISDAFMDLAGTGNIDLSGASGPLDFNVANGDVLGDIQVWCVLSDKTATPKPASLGNSGQYFDATTQKLAGTFSCP